LKGENMKITITEALAELRTIERRVPKKQQFCLGFLWRQDALRDPHEKSGGSATLIKRERQGITDLLERLISIRRAIAKANAETKLTVAGKTRTIADWLVWRREVAPVQSRLLNQMSGKLDGMRQDAVRKQIKIVEKGQQAGSLEDVVVNINEAELAEEIEHLEEVLGTLDGALSLANATTIVDIP
jgi:hypothetical protein